MAKFVSNAKDYWHFLEMTEAGGKWAEFRNGQYETKNEVHAQKLRNAPNFGKDFYEVGHVEEKPEEKPEIVIESGNLFKCPVCGITKTKKGKPFDTAAKAQLHCRMEHKKEYARKDIEKVA